ncbi:hypothetical protein SmJEL517_g02593 [Synchytrium microbalum]|uniref:Ras-GEF domain-containing protein n=1 Tax=Synchytrium microbalum TaxID=1806994 RepID=A0A507CBK3_9FUNG|nr:uncharacterized protein SmJEL517_g02593 [Synchytrium microbalum]TPX34923.1 hypothetical protein SmJEL517_g02593 [Synchytrium microbalum]
MSQIISLSTGDLLSNSQDAFPVMMGMNQGENVDEKAEFQLLKTGVSYPAKVTALSQPLLQGKEDVIIRLDVGGIHISTPELEELLDLELQHVLQYSYNRTKQTFTFSHLDRDGLLSQYKFVSPKYFDIFDFLGRAIAAVIKQATAAGSPTAAARVADFSRESPTVMELPKLPSKLSSRRPSANPAPSLLSTSNTSARKPLAGLFEVDSPTSPSSMTLHKVAIAKHLMEEKYENKSSKEIVEALKSPVDPVAPPSPVDSIHPELPIEVKPTKVEFITQPILTEEAQASKKQQGKKFGTLSRLLSKRVRPDKVATTGSEPALNRYGTVRMSREKLSTAAGTKTIGSAAGGSQNQLDNKSNSVMALFRNPTTKSPKGTVRKTVTRSEDVLNKKSNEKLYSSQTLGHGRAASGGKWKEKLSASTEFLAYATVNRRAFSAAKASTAAPTSPIEMLRGNAVITAGSPAVLKIRDNNQQEILIKNLRDETAYEIVAGTPDALVDALVDDPDLLYLEVFLLTFRHFMTPIVLLNHLQTKFLNSSTEMHSPVDATQVVDGNLPSIVMHRIVSIVKKWVGEHSYDFLLPEMRNALDDFLRVVRTTEYKHYADQIQQIVSHEMVSLETLLRKRGTHSSLDPLAPAPIQTTSELKELLVGFELMNHKAKHIAQQLTLADSKMFRAIKPEEFAIFLWGDKTAKSARQLQAYIDRFNKIGYWVGTIVCSYEQLQKRTEAIEKFIKVARKCLELQNFNSAMAIFSGLNTNSVSRMKKSWAGVSSRVMGFYKELEDTLSYRGNYKAYREMEHLAKPPLIPFFGLMIKDLTFLNDGNQKILSNGLINFEKNRLIFNVINAMRQFQRDKYPIVPDESLKISSILTGARSISLHQYCASPPCLREDQLMNLSRAVEPPEAKGTGGDANPATTPTSVISTNTATGTIRGIMSAMSMSSPSLATSSNNNLASTNAASQSGIGAATIRKAGLSTALLQMLAAAEELESMPPPLPIKDKSVVSLSGATSSGSLLGIAGREQESTAPSIISIISPAATIINTKQEGPLSPAGTVVAVPPSPDALALTPVTPSPMWSEVTSPTGFDSPVSQIQSATPASGRRASRTPNLMTKRASLMNIDPFEATKQSARPPSIVTKRSSMISLGAIDASLSINLIGPTPQGTVKSRHVEPTTPITFEDIWGSIHMEQDDDCDKEENEVESRNNTDDVDDDQDDDDVDGVSQINPMGIVSPPSNAEMDRATHLQPRMDTTPKAVRKMLRRLSSQVLQQQLSATSSNSSVSVLLPPVVGEEYYTASKSPVVSVRQQQGRVRSDSASTVVKFEMGEPSSPPVAVSPSPAPTQNLKPQMRGFGGAIDRAATVVRPRHQSPSSASPLSKSSSDLVDAPSNLPPCSSFVSNYTTTTMSTMQTTTTPSQHTNECSMDSINGSESLDLKRGSADYSTAGTIEQSNDSIAASNEGLEASGGIVNSLSNKSFRTTQSSESRQESPTSGSVASMAKAFENKGKQAQISASSESVGRAIAEMYRENVGASSETIGDAISGLFVDSPTSPASPQQDATPNLYKTNQ